MINVRGRRKRQMCIRDRHRIALAALPFLMHDRPFVQGIAVSAEIGAAIGGSIHRAAQRRRPWLPGYDDEH